MALVHVIESDVTKEIGEICCFMSFHDHGLVLSVSGLQDGVKQCTKDGITKTSIVDLFLVLLSNYILFD